jgi:uncharacterized protein (TIGR02001 family)
MKKVVLSVVAALAVAASASFAHAADLPVKGANVVPPPPPNPWDIAFGSAIVSNYMWRGISQSGNDPSVWAYFEPHYNITKDLQLYAGISGESIKFPNKASAEIDFYGGIRPTFGPLAFDIGFWYYYYPGGDDYYATANFGPFAAIPDASFYEVYGKVTWTVNDYIAIGGNIFYTPSYLNTGADGTYYSGTFKLTAPSNWLPSGIGAYLSGELGRQELGTTDIVVEPTGAVFSVPTDLPSYTTWNIGGGFTWKVFTLDLRYSDTDLSKENCFLITGDPNAGVNAAGAGTSNWCGSTFIAKLAADLTLDSLK